MSQKIKIFSLSTILMISFFGSIGCSEKPKTIIEFLESTPGITFEEIGGDSIFQSTYKIMIEQPLDHNNPNGKKFTQKAYLSHLNEANPMAIITNGYDVGRNYTREIARYLDANQLFVEHRFFGESKPDSMEWKYLTIEQAANDLHRITELFKNFYHNKWVSSGISKGGQTTIFYRKFFPNDVVVSVPYVAPLNLAKEDPRLYDYLENKAGTRECRKKIIEFQRSVLSNRSAILPILKKYADNKGLVFTYNDFETAFEYMVLEYSFSFWQWDGDCSKIPDNSASIKEIFDHVVEVSSMELFADADMEKYSSFQYQANTEMGYYGFKIAPFKDLLKSITKDVGSEMSFPYRDVELVFNSKTVNDINSWIQTHGNNIIYIYGELDAWSATAVDVSSHTNALKIVKKDGDHKTRIRNLPKEQQDLVFEKLEKWLELEVKRDLIF